MSALPAPEARLESYAASLYQRHSSAVYRHCLKQLRRREDADDATQTTFVYALLSLRRGVVPAAELAWLYTIASNVCSSNRRAGARRGALAAAQDVDALHDVIPTPDRNVPVTADEFRAALTAMPETQRRALLLREWRGLSYSEIADRLGLTQSATETLLFRARRTLAGKLQEKAGAGFSLAAFLRSLLQTGAGKTIAVGLGAAAIAVAPSAERRTVPATPRATVVSHRVVSPRTIAPQPGSPVHEEPTHKAAHAATPLSASAIGAEDVQPDVGSPASPPSVPPPPPISAAPESEAQPSASPPPPPLPPAPASVVEAPAVSLPPLPIVENLVPPLPDVQLPAVTVPPLPLP